MFATSVLRVLPFAPLLACGGIVSGTAPVDGGLGDADFADAGDTGRSDAADASQPIPVQLSAGIGNVCALFSDGTVSCWGAVASDQTGTPSPTPSPLPAAVDEQQVNAGGYAGCLLSKAGAVSCFGDDLLGSVGDGHSGDGAFVTTPTQIIPAGVASVSVGESSACALMTNGDVSCWGANRYGEDGPNAGPVGLGAVDATPTPVTGLPPTAAVTMGRSHACALSVDHETINCWGYGEDGELGDGMSGTGHDRSTPGPVVGMPSGVSTIASGENLSCAIDGAGVLWCWGWNAEAQLGTGAPGAPATTPTRVPGLASVKQVSIGLEDGVCAVTAMGATYCWGAYDVSLDYPDAAVRYFPPTLVTGVPLATQVTVGEESACVLGVDSTVWCWGLNESGECGPLASGDFVTTPVQVPF